MKVEEIQFIGRPPMFGGNITTIRLRIGSDNGVKNMTVVDDSVLIERISGPSIVVPKSSVYMVLAAAPEAPAAPAKKVQAKSA